MISRALYIEQGGLRGMYVRGDYEDSDLCLRLLTSGYDNWYLPDVELYFYDELDAGERREVEAHLTSCAACRDALDEMKTIRVALAAREAVVSPPGGDWARLMSRMVA